MVSQIAYHASHEQFSPRDLLTYVKLSEQAGFDSCHSSDHFHPWSKRQGQSGLAFVWIGAAMEATQFPFSFVNAPGQRYHPAIVAQAIATLEQLYPKRLTIALGSGEALNENITGEEWPDKSTRNARLLESVDIIRRLLSGETVTHHGLVTVNEATLYTRPDTIPCLMGAALSDETVRWVGSWADGLLMGHHDQETMKRRIDAFRTSGGEGKPIHVQLSLSYDRNDQDALKGALHQWRTNLLSSEERANLYLPEHFDQKTEYMTTEEIKSKLLITSSLEQCIDVIHQTMELDVETIIIHNVNRNQQLFIEDFGTSVLPALREKTNEVII